MSIFEALMLLCFGAGWPFSIAKSLRTRTVTGKSPMFMIIIDVGYVCGTIHKLFYSFDWVIALYILNFIMVTWDLILYYRYSRPTANAGKTAG